MDDATVFKLRVEELALLAYRSTEDQAAKTRVADYMAIQFPGCVGGNYHPFIECATIVRSDGTRIDPWDDVDYQPNDEELSWLANYMMDLLGAMEAYCVPDVQGVPSSGEQSRRRYLHQRVKDFETRMGQEWFVAVTGEREKHWLAIIDDLWDEYNRLTADGPIPDEMPDSDTLPSNPKGNSPGSTPHREPPVQPPLE
jgi:hypothetical protein